MNKINTLRTTKRNRWAHWTTRFWEYVDQSDRDGCWLWKGPRLGTRTPASGVDYGRIRCNGKLILAHRASWVLHFGEIPGGLIVRHRCDNGLCVNPAHLETGTQHDNIRDMFDRGRQPDFTWEKGPRAKLSEQQVAEIRSLRGVISQEKIGERFGIHQAHVSKIQLRKTWRE